MRNYVKMEDGGSLPLFCLRNQSFFSQQSHPPSSMVTLDPHPDLQRVQSLQPQLLMPFLLWWIM